MHTLMSSDAFLCLINLRGWNGRVVWRKEGGETGMVLIGCVIGVGRDYLLLVVCLCLMLGWMRLCLYGIMNEEG